MEAHMYQEYNLQVSSLSKIHLFTTNGTLDSIKRYKKRMKGGGSLK